MHIIFYNYINYYIEKFIIKKSHKYFKLINLHLKKNCLNPGSNQGHLDLQSNALPAELLRLCNNIFNIIYK